MYHEVTEPYEFLWNLREGLKPGGLVIVVDSDRPVKRHGMPPRQLMCEFAALGLAPVRTSRLAGSDAYFAAFRAVRPRPEPGSHQALHRRTGAKGGPSAACCCIVPGKYQMVEDREVDRFARAGQSRVARQSARLAVYPRPDGCAPERCPRCRALPHRR